MTMAAMAPGPSEPAGGRGFSPARGGGGGPLALRLPASPSVLPPGPPSAAGAASTAAGVQPLPGSAVLGAGRGGGGRGAGGRGLQDRAGALHGAVSRGQVGRLVPQGGHGLLRALGCKAKKRRALGPRLPPGMSPHGEEALSWGPGAQHDPSLPAPQVRPRGALCCSVALSWAKPGSPQDRASGTHLRP